MANEEFHPEEVQLKIEKEKTRRQIILYAMVGVGALIVVLYFLRTDPVTGQTKKLEITKDGIKIENSIVAQAVTNNDVGTTEYNNGKDKVKFTTGEISSNLVQRLQTENNIQVSAGSFTGNNYINPIEGFVVPVSNAGLYTLNYNPGWGNDPSGTAYISQIAAADGGVFEARYSIADENLDIRTVTESALGPFIQALSGNRPEIKYDLPSNTSFLSVFVPANNKNVVMKIVKKGNRFYNFGARYDPGSQSEQELLGMVANATLIGS